jgi:pyruvate dehydrogenase E2 component (dihydrolipoamide acetyltransferase)
MNAAARLVEVRVPDMGNFKDVAVIDVLVKPGETIEPEAPLVTLETEKATMDVPSTASGIIEQVHVAKGGKVSAGDLIATVRSEGIAVEAAAEQPPVLGSAAAPESPPAPAASESPPAAAAAPAAPRASAPAPPVPPSHVHAGPSVRKLARELGVDLSQVSGHGFKGRITHEDVKTYVKSTFGPEALKEAPRPPLPARSEAPPPRPAPAAPRAAPVQAMPARPAPAAAAEPAAKSTWPAVPEVDFSLFGPTEVQPLSRIQRIAGPRLHASWVNIPHVTQFDEADITELEEARNRLKASAAQAGVKLTPLAFIVRACVRALRVFPQLNASLDATGSNLILKKYYHIGFAADTPAGLVVPVIRDAERRDVYGIARQLSVLSDKARAGKLQPQEVQGGCFTISSLGGIGGTAFTPIINAPEVAILGVSRSTVKPVFRDGKFVPRLMLPLSLSYDHRVVDGAMAVRFTTFLAQTLADPRGLTEAVP